MILAIALQDPQAPDTCPECGATGLINDTDAGEVVCPRCGLVVDVIVSRGPEWMIFEPNHMHTLPRASPTSLPALSMDDSTYLTRTWTHRNPETQATMHRLRFYQNKISDSRGRNFHHAKKTLYKLGDNAHVPRRLLDQAAYIYRRAYETNLVRGRTVQSLMAASIYLAYRLQKVPRHVKEIAGCMDIEVKELTRVYRLLVEELHLSPENPKAEDHMPRLADALGLTREETQTAIDIIREARRLKHTIGKDPRGLAAAAVYIAQLPRPPVDKITQGKIALASGVTEVTIRNRYKSLTKIAATLFPVFSGFPGFPVSPIKEK